MSKPLTLRQVSVQYGHFEAVHQVSLAVPRGDIGCLLGPSGCGKTTLLRAIAGFEAVSQGEITLGDRVISSPASAVPPEQRRVGMVFQDFALFPHLNIQRNVGFGLTRLSAAQRRRRVAELLELVGLQSSANAWPHELSGGQQQRVAVARALAPEPDILLLDEPFSSLDTELREQLAQEVRELIKRSDITAILVTHDQHEAFTMADQVTLLQAGRVAQSGTPHQLYHQPANEFVAGFIGQGSIINVGVEGSGETSNRLGRLDPQRLPQPGSNSLTLLIRPDDVQHTPGSQLQLTVTGKAFRGAHYLYELALDDGQRIKCLTSGRVDVALGALLPVQLMLQQVVILDPG